MISLFQDALDQDLPEKTIHKNVWLVEHEPALGLKQSLPLFS